MQLLTAQGSWASVPLASDRSGFLTGGPAVESTVDLIMGPDGLPRRAGYVDVYRANPWLWANVQLLARSMSRFPLKIFKDLGDTKQRVKPGAGSRVASLAAAVRRPGHGYSQQTLWHSTSVDRFVHGNGLWFIERDRVGMYTGFRRIPWRWEAHETVAGVLRYWDTRKPNEKRLADDVIHFGSNLDCDDLVNPSPIQSLRATLALYDAVERTLLGFFKNSARPSGHLEIDRGTGKVAQGIIRAELEKLYTTPENAGKVLVTSGKWSSITETPEHMRVVELAKQSREEICAAYGMPPPMVGILDRAIMSNVRELRSHLGRDVVGPHAVLFEGDFDAQLIARDPLLGLAVAEFEMAAMLRPDLEARSATWKDQRYVRTLNEIRDDENLERIDHPDADVPWMPMNEQPLGADNSPKEDDDKDDEDDPKPPAPGDENEEDT